MHSHSSRFPRPAAAPVVLALTVAFAAACHDKSELPATSPPTLASSPPSSAASSAPAAAASADSARERARAKSQARVAALEAALKRAEEVGGGRLGVAVVHVESGERVAIHADERFPMQSVFKLPLAIDVLAHVDAGDIRLDDVVTITPADLRPGPAGGITQELPNGGKRPLRVLLERMVIQSDNTAADLLLARVGGGPKVTERLRGLGITGIDVSRSEAQLMMDAMGVTAPLPAAKWTYPAFQALLGSTSPATRTKALAATLADPRDTATPAAMADLLVRVQRNDLLAPASAALLIDLLEKTSTGTDRLKADLPPGTPLAHRTGTSGTVDGITAATNDVGYITITGNGGHVVVAAFIKASKAGDAGRARALAMVGRAAFDAYTPP